MVRDVREEKKKGKVREKKMDNRFNKLTIFFFPVNLEPIMAQLLRPGIIAFAFNNY